MFLMTTQNDYKKTIMIFIAAPCTGCGNPKFKKFFIYGNFLNLGLPKAERRKVDDKI